MKYFAKPLNTDEHLDSEKYYPVKEKEYLNRNEIWITIPDGYIGYVGSKLVDIYIKLGDSYMKEEEYSNNHFKDIIRQSNMILDMAKRYNKLGVVTDESLKRIEILCGKGGLMSLTNEDEFFQREDVKNTLLGRSKDNSEDKGLKINFPLNEEELLKLLEICQEPSFQVPSGLTREERRQWVLNKISQEDAMNELVSLSEDLGLYDAKSATVVSDRSLMTAE